ncbi:hypothetical protein M513_12455 [Trichuris suis]|uniref:Uncharacterized protein n=1 Tax=Trichuris suis TaxID=68888 RepID=A0A085LNZ1_9BILA|nr:hypothetical protein M513_12455 [Trichuris suis]
MVAAKASNRIVFTPLANTSFSIVFRDLELRSLNTMEKLVLAKGLNFIPTPKKVSFADLIARVEQSLINVEPNKANQIRGAISTILTRTKYTPKKNLTLMEMKILKDIKKDKNIIITRADKGNAVVVLNRNTYTSNVKQLLVTGSYKPIKVDPTDNVRKRLKTKLTRYAEETKEEQLLHFAKFLKYSSNTKCPELYCLPKIHKPGNPFRPIVSSTSDWEQNQFEVYLQTHSKTGRSHESKINYENTKARYKTSRLQERTIIENAECVGTLNESSSQADEKTDENRSAIAFPPACMIYAAFGYSLSVQ